MRMGVTFWADPPTRGRRINRHGTLQMHNEQVTESKIRRGVFNPLILLNIAVFCLAMALAPRAQFPLPLSGDPVTDFFNVRDFSDIFGIMSASLFFSWAVYSSVTAWVLPASPSNANVLDSEADNDIQP